MDEIAEIKSRLNIVELIGQSVKLTRAGRNFKGLCPFHNEHSPSFMVSPERGTWRCFGCGEHGDAFTWLEKHDNLSFNEALEQLAQQTGVVLTKRNHKQVDKSQRVYQLLQLAAEYYHYILTQHQLGKEAKEYLVTRNINDKTIKEFLLGYAPNSWQSLRQFAQQKGFNDLELAQAGLSSQGTSGREFDRFRGRLMFPVTDTNGRVVGFSGRSLIDSDDMPKYLNSPDTEVFHKGRLLFGLTQAKNAIRQNQRLVLVEGNVDLLSSYQAGLAEVVAPLGTALTPEQAGIIKRFTQKVILAYDKDKAGQAAIWRSVPILQQQQLDIAIVELPHGKDPDECIQYSAKDWIKAVDHAKEVFIYLLSVLDKTYDLSSAKGKSQAVETVAPFINSIKDGVARSFAIHQAADAIGVSEKDIELKAKDNKSSTIIITSSSDQLEDNRNSPIQGSDSPSLSQQERLSTYLLATIITSSSNSLPLKALNDIVLPLKIEALPQHHQSIATIIKDNIAQLKDLNLNDIAASLPPNLVAVFDQLSLTAPESLIVSGLNLTDADKINGSNNQAILESLHQAIQQLNTLYLKQQLNLIAQQIKRANVLNSGEQDSLKQKFIQISQELSQIK